MRRSVCSRPNVLTSTGIGMRVPQAARPACPAVIIVTRSGRGAGDDLLAEQAPPLPLIIRNCGSISSAPSRLMSRPIDLVQVAERDLQADAPARRSPRWWARR